jgi:hypothetical protein
MKLKVILLLVMSVLLLAACGADENNPLSTGEQGGQVAAPDTLEGDGDSADDGALEAAEDAAVDNEGQNVDDDVADDSVSPGDAETIGDSGDGQGATSGDDNDESTTADDDDDDGMTAPAFVSEWESGGATVVTGGEVPVSLFDGAAGQTYIVDDAELQVYQFDDEDAAETAAETISADGGMINDVSVRWAGAPHFYRLGDTIVLYVGDDAATLERLGGSLGTPFAGTGASE